MKDYTTRDDVEKIIQERFNTNYYSGVPRIPPHTHNGVDNLQIPYANLLNQPSILGGVNGFQVFTTSGTFTVPTGFTKFIVRAVGGGKNATQSVSTSSTGASGNGADYAESLVTLTVATVTVTIGANGSTGGDTTFGSYLLAKGAGSASTNIGSVIVSGEPAGNGFATGSGTFSGKGGNSMFGYGGTGVFGSNGTANGTAGNNAVGYGAGGSGNANGSGVTNFGSAGTGTSGLLLISW